MSDPRDDLPAFEGDGPDDPAAAASDFVVLSDEEEAAVEGGGEGPELDPRRAYEVLEIRTPLEEFDAYARARIETLARLGEAERAEITAAALELGRRAIARVTGVPLPPFPGRGEAKGG